MPRGIPNKPKEPLEAPKAVSEKDAIYSRYVHGEPINSIAARLKVESQEVLDVINKIEESKG